MVINGQTFNIHIYIHVYYSSLFPTLTLSSDCRAFIEYLDYTKTALRWEFIKDFKKKKKENTPSIKKSKFQEKFKEKTLSTKNKSKIKEKKRKERKHAQELDQDKKQV